jgi:hypothetical protein
LRAPRAAPPFAGPAVSTTAEKRGAAQASSRAAERVARGSRAPRAYPPAAGQAVSAISKQLAAARAATLKWGAYDGSLLVILGFLNSSDIVPFLQANPGLPLPKSFFSNTTIIRIRETESVENVRSALPVLCMFEKMHIGWNEEHLAVLQNCTALRNLEVSSELKRPRSTFAQIMRSLDMFGCLVALTVKCPNGYLDFSDLEEFVQANPEMSLPASLYSSTTLRIPEEIDALRVEALQTILCMFEKIQFGWNRSHLILLRHCAALRSLDLRSDVHLVEFEVEWVMRVLNTIESLTALKIHTPEYDEHPLHQASHYGFPWVVRLLLLNDDPAYTAEFINQAKHAARLRGKMVVVGLLEKYVPRVACSGC